MLEEQLAYTDGFIAVISDPPPNSSVPSVGTTLPLGGKGEGGLTGTRLVPTGPPYHTTHPRRHTATGSEAEAHP